MRLLVVEDDVDVARFLRKGLTEHAYAVDVADDGETALELASLNPYDVVILDLMLPGTGGMEVCRQLRHSGSHVPILILTARDSVDDKIEGLDSGADDYLAKPFEFRELLARLRALLRREPVAAPSVVRVGELHVDTRSHQVHVNSEPLLLTAKEYSLLEFLARHSGHVISREEISEHVWNQDFDPFSNLIEVYINRLRRHLERVSAKKWIQTIRGAGYVLTDPDSSERRP
ncbi:MAG: response regulator transcription factor [Acidobacteriota bacterium]